MIGRRRFLVASALGVAAGTTMGAAGCSRRERPPTAADAVEVAFDAAETEVDLGGLTVRTWTYTQTVPAREIRLRRGQTLRTVVRNHLPQPTTVHWHGLAIPNPMDGVPVLTQSAIAPGDQFRYEFTVPDAGTYYLHSHVGTQLDRGMYGPLIIEDPDDGRDYDDELVVVLDDWIDGTGTTPDQVAENLKMHGMRPMAGPPAPLTPVRPLGEDGGDVTYPYFLINGRTPTDPQVRDFRAGQRIRLRIINAGADTAFRVGVPGTRLTLTHADGYPVVPREAESVLLGMGERADAIITLTSSAPVVAAPYGKDGHAQLTMRVDGKPSDVDVAKFVEALRTQAPVNTSTLEAAPDVVLPQRDPDTVIDLRLQGPMAHYTWPINGRRYDPPNNGIALQPNQRVRVRFVSESEMFHPMHLHGHTYAVVHPAGHGPRKDTVLVPPRQTVEVDFDTDNPGRWIVHCHNDYHLGGGMATFVEYSA